MAIPDPDTLYDEHEDVQLGTTNCAKMTTCAAVRAVMGLSDAELADDVLAQPIYARSAERRLKKLSSNTVANWLDLISDTAPAETVSLYELIQDYLTYVIAVHVCESLILLAARTVTDSKASFQRFDVDLSQLLEALQSRLGELESDLASELGVEDSSTYVTMAIFGDGAPTTDPVTENPDAD